MPKYMVKKPPSGISVVILAEALTSHLFKITANEKQFPKAYRYTLVSQIRNTCLDLNRHIYNGCVKKAMTTKEFKRIKKYQKKAYADLIDLKALLVIANNIAQMNNISYVADLYQDTVEAFNRWVRNIKRSSRKIKWKESMTDEERLEFRLGIQAKRMKRDADGFAVLIPVKSGDKAE